MAESPLKTDLILRGRIARRLVTFVGTMEGDELKQISGSVTLNVSLSSILNDLGADYGEAASVLTLLAGGDQEADIVLGKLGAAYLTGASKVVQVGLIIKFGDNSCQFALLKGMGDKKGFIVGVDLRSDKAVLPNNFLSGLIGDISIGNLGVYYASEAFEDVSFLGGDAFQDATQITLETPPIAGRNFPKGVKVSAEILIGGVNLLDKLEQYANADAPAASQNTRIDSTGDDDKPVNEAKETLSKGSTRWIEANKTIGPVSVRRVGLSYDAPRIGIKLDASLELSVLTLSLEGLGLSYPIDKFTTKPKDIWENLKFHLDGAAVTFAEGPLTISGGLLKVKDVPLQLDGALLIRTEMWTVSAVGSYADLNGTPSFFAFAVLQKALGGPPFFFVTGLAFGFGVNRALKLPTINEVENFPLVKGAIDPNYLGEPLDLREVSQKLGEYIFPSEGNFWMAIGVKFTSFGQIDSFALLSVSFGTQFEIALLGLSKIRVPKPPAEPIVYAELAMKAVFAPDSGLLSFEARLTENSYVLRKDFKLRGGFAFYSWFAGEHEGDFVVSLGGYHPRFQPPAHYPKPDLVEFHCKTGDTTIQGYCYFALCPSAIMAGGGLSIVYQISGIKAWFIANADFLIQWKPLYYDIAIGVTVGVALHLKIVFVRVNLSVELSASVNLYGPPLGGKARISLYVITFTVEFGEARHIPPPLLWESEDAEKSFAKSFLPNPDVTSVSIADGLLQEIKNGDQTTRFVNPHRLVLSCRTLVPVTEASFNGEKFTREREEEKYKVTQPTINGQPTQLGVRPMGKSKLHSLIEVTLVPNGDATKASDYLNQYIEVSLTTKSVPLALWGKPVQGKDKNKPPAANEQMIDHALVGLEIRTKPGPRPWETPALDLKVLAYDRYTKKFEWAVVKPRTALPGFGKKTISNTIEETEVAAKRGAILDALAKTGRRIMSPEEIHLSQLSANAQYIFQAMPAMARVGQNPPRKFLET